MDQYRVFGNPIKQSRSPAIHQAFAENTQQNIHYSSELVELDAFELTIKNFNKLGGKGANVTVPFKEQALVLCDQLSDRARLAGAVNTLIFKEGLILGDNTDGLGLVQDLLSQHVTLNNKKILLLGAGGAAKGVILPLLKQNPCSITIANRTVSKAKDLCQQFQQEKNQTSNLQEKLNACGFEQLNSPRFDIIINATSASLSGAIPAINERIIDENTVCYDMVYGKGLTPFLLWAQSHGAKATIDGLGMLVGQAAESFLIWRGVKPETKQVLLNLRESIEASKE
jgi:shikimate dehydrogenase